MKEHIPEVQNLANGKSSTYNYHTNDLYIRLISLSNCSTSFFLRGNAQITLEHLSQLLTYGVPQSISQVHTFSNFFCIKICIIFVYKLLPDAYVFVYTFTSQERANLICRIPSNLVCSILHFPVKTAALDNCHLQTNYIFCSVILTNNHEIYVYAGV